MSDLTLYRKYRPTSFSNVLGQDHIVKVLESSIKKGDIGHAYLFSGSRGTGKTSVARIFAESVGCSSADLYEIDAASNRGVDEVRAIREAVHTMPYQSKYKIYILDEAHMLTKEAWNALLKTLEEPPKHVIFILATTELEKVPETVISRCQTFSFKRPTQKLLKEMIESVADGEGYVIEKDAADLVAFLGDGSFRDSESILQKVISASEEKKITLSQVELISGAPRHELLNEVLRGLDEDNVSNALVAVNDAIEENADMKMFTKLLIERVRSILFIRFAPEMLPSIKDEYGEKDFSVLEAISKNKETKINSKTLSELLKAFEEINFASHKNIPLELALMRILGE